MIITNAVMDIVSNIYFYYGDFYSCHLLQFCNDGYLVVSL